ncbi:MAG TPA: isocitrate lyase/phosphoenolpyruvate mutase family protein [Capillimicrobium sp.]
MSGLSDQAARLRALHLAPEVLVLPNAWDPVSARRLAADGALAVATSSAAVARAMGSEDEQRMAAEDMLAAVARIAVAVPEDVPVTADMEAGYGLAPQDLVRGLAGAGAVGCNLEDTDHRSGGLRPVAEQAALLRAVKAAGDVVVNARVDVHLDGGSLEEGLERARAYREAGADCVYPIFAPFPDAVRAYVEAVGPVNVIVDPADPGAPSLRALAEAGVARVTFGGGLAAVAYDAASAAWLAFRDA